jgi:site-specific DNA-methyltransferase (adenine-specific)
MEYQSVDLIVTSPPYDNLRDYKGFSFNFPEILHGICKIMKTGGVVVWVVGDETKGGSESGVSFKQALSFMEAGFNLHDTMIYQKRNVLPLNDRRYEPCFEYMFVFSVGSPKTFNPILVPKIWEDNRDHKQCGREKDGSPVFGFSAKTNKKVKTNIWDYKTGGGNVTGDKVAYGHPAIFPERLAEDHIYSWSNPGDLVYDPMAGSGTTLKMAIKLDRNWIGSEISAEYCKIAMKRIKAERQKITLF